MSDLSFLQGYGPSNPLIMSTAGLCKSWNLEQIAAFAAAADKVPIGSITPLERAGNDGTCEWFDNPLYGLNSWGMPNAGPEGLPVFKRGTHEFRQMKELHKNRTLIISIAGFSAVDYWQLFKQVVEWAESIDLNIAIELNFGCPNTREGGAHHPSKITSFDPIELRHILAMIGSLAPSFPVGVKLSPYSDPGLLKEVAAAIREAHTLSRRYILSTYLVDYVATCNTFPNGLGYTLSHWPAIQTEQTGRYGGISGEALKPISLSNAAQFREELPPEIHVIRVGGVSSGEDVWQSYDVGCTGVQLGTVVAREGLGAFTRIREEYADLVS